MVEIENVNVNTPDAESLTAGIIAGAKDSLNELIRNVKNGGNEFFLTTTISLMLVFGFVRIWRRI